LVRELCIDAGVEKKSINLPLNSPQAWVQVSNVLDLSKSFFMGSFTDMSFTEADSA